MNPAKEIKKHIAVKAVNRLFTALEKQDIFNKDISVKVDLFNTGIVIDISKAVKKYYPRFAPVVKRIIEREIKKL
jgi:hypothetical protein